MDPALQAPGPPPALRWAGAQRGKNPAQHWLRGGAPKWGVPFGVPTNVHHALQLYNRDGGLRCTDPRKPSMETDLFASCSLIIIYHVYTIPSTDYLPGDRCMCFLF